MRRRDELLVGLLLIVSLTVGILGTIWLVRGGFSQGYPLYARFPWGAGLKQGQPVQLAGVQVGYVADVELDPMGTLFAELRIEDQYGIPVGSTASVVPVGIFGDQAIALIPERPSTTYIARGDTLVVYSTDHGDWLDEDQWCLYTPKGGEKIKVAFNVSEETDVAWDDASTLRLSRIPYFLRAMVKKGVEKHARENNVPLITVELMEELRKKRFGNDAPVFNFDVKGKG